MARAGMSGTSITAIFTLVVILGGGLVAYSSLSDASENVRAVEAAKFASELRNELGSLSQGSVLDVSSSVPAGVESVCFVDSRIIASYLAGNPVSFSFSGASPLAQSRIRSSIELPSSINVFFDYGDSVVSPEGITDTIPISFGQDFLVTCFPVSGRAISLRAVGTTDGPILDVPESFIIPSQDSSDSAMPGAEESEQESASPEPESESEDSTSGTEPAPRFVCGDGYCSDHETPDTCSEDCSNSYEVGDTVYTVYHPNLKIFSEPSFTGATMLDYVTAYPYPGVQASIIDGPVWISRSFGGTPFTGELYKVDVEGEGIGWMHASHLTADSDAYVPFRTGAFVEVWRVPPVWPIESFVAAEPSIEAEEVGRPEVGDWGIVTQSMQRELYESGIYTRARWWVKVQFNSGLEGFVRAYYIRDLTPQTDGLAGPGFEERDGLCESGDGENVMNSPDDCVSLQNGLCAVEGFPPAYRVFGFQSSSRYVVYSSECCAGLELVDNPLYGETKEAIYTSGTFEPQICRSRCVAGARNPDGSCPVADGLDVLPEGVYEGSGTIVTRAFERPLLTHENRIPRQEDRLYYAAVAHGIIPDTRQGAENFLAMLLSTPSSERPDWFTDWHSAWRAEYGERAENSPAGW